MRMLLALLTALFFGVAPALADSPSIGADLNLVIGRQKQSSQTGTSLPTVPVPMFSLKVPLRRFEIFAEGVPPIGPVAYGDGHGTTQATKISYMALEGRWRFLGDRASIGAGTALVNQATFYSRFGPASEQSSRVAGLRLSARLRLENRLQSTTDFTMAFSPSMHGLQHTFLRFPAFVCYPKQARCGPVWSVDDAELASLVDVQAARTRRFGRYALRYGVRYINYSARFPNGRPADRERLVMPFAGVVLSLGH